MTTTFETILLREMMNEMRITLIKKHAYAFTRHLLIIEKSKNTTFDSQEFWQNVGRDNTRQQEYYMRSGAKVADIITFNNEVLDLLPTLMKEIDILTAEQAKKILDLN